VIVMSWFPKASTSGEYRTTLPYLMRAGNGHGESIMIDESSPP
jgi:hypothetical protein